MNIHDMQLLGIHNVENVMAAIAMSSPYSVPMEHILNTVKHFKAVEHRIEYVATKRGRLLQRFQRNQPGRGHPGNPAP